MIKISRSVTEIQARSELDFRMFGDVAEVSFDSRIFERARDVFTEGRSVLAVNAIEDNAEGHKIYLMPEKDILLDEKTLVPYHTNFEGDNLLNEKDKLDTAILENVDVVFFQQVDEYSWSVANLIRGGYPEKKVFFFDEFVNLFDSGLYLAVQSTYLSKLLTKKCMYVISDETAEKLEMLDNCCYRINILCLMNTLCWARTRCCYGEKNRDKTIMLIDLEVGGRGLGDIVKMVSVFASLAWERGWYPVAYVHDGQYLDDKDDNVWDYYFEPLSDISVKEAKESYCVISLSENNVSIGHVWLTPCFRGRLDVFDPRIAIQSSLINRFEVELPVSLKQKAPNVLGVVTRGTDWARGNITEEQIQSVIDTCRTLLEEKYDALFLATEEVRYYQAFVEAFSEDRLLSVPQKRVDYDYKRKEYKSIAQLLDIPLGERRAWGEKYLFITYCLSKCKALYLTIGTGAVWLAKRWKVNDGADFESTNVFGDRSHSYTEELSKYENFMEAHETIIVWGVGYLTNRLEYFFQRYVDKLIFCDRKAECEEIIFLGKKVKSAKEIRQYIESSTGVFIMAADFADVIEKELLSWNVSQSNILKVKRSIASELVPL